METIKLNDTGSAVEDVQKRFRILGYDLQVDGIFGPKTLSCLHAFCTKRSLPLHDYIDDKLWFDLVDATFNMGDRMLYLRMPYFHGHDVEKLQNILEVMGFIVGDPDGIFGANTERALREFQASVGIDDDGIAGETSFDAIRRLHYAWEGKQALSNDADQCSGFARAEKALRSMDACFYGMDVYGRVIAQRIANLAQATSLDAHVHSAQNLVDVPSQDALLVGIACAPVAPEAPAGVVVFSQDTYFQQRLHAACESAATVPKRIIIALSPFLKERVRDLNTDEHLQQHLAVVLLDAFCAVFS